MEKIFRLPVSPIGSLHQANGWIWLPNGDDTVAACSGLWFYQRLVINFIPNQHNMRIRLLILLLSLPAGAVSAQVLVENQFRQYTTAQGLTHDNCTGIAQDSTGYIWIATSSGLNRFNGSRFVNYHSNDDPHSIPSENLGGFSWLNRNELAVSGDGLHIIHTGTGQSRNIFIPYADKNYQYKFNMVTRMLGDASGNKYMLTRSGFYEFDRRDSLVFRFDYYKKEDVPLQHFFFGSDIMELDKNRLMIVSVDGLYLYEKKDRTIRKMKAGDLPQLDEFIEGARNGYRFFQIKKGVFFVFKFLNNTVAYVDLAAGIKTFSSMPFDQPRTEISWRSRILRWSDTSYYITGHQSGIYRLGLDPKTGVVNCDPQKYFPSLLCNDLFRDRDGNMWIASNKGLFRQMAPTLIVETAAIPEAIENTSADIKFYDLHVTKDKIFGATRQGGLLQFNKQTLAFDTQYLFAHPHQNIIRAIEPVDRDLLFLGNYAEPLLFNQQTGKSEMMKLPLWEPGDWIPTMLKDRRGDLWISSYRIYRYRHQSREFTIIPSHNKLLEAPSHLGEDSEGNIWVAGHGLARYNITTNRYDHLVDAFPYIKMPDKQVTALTIDKNNTVWFNSNNNGLIAYYPATGKFRHFTTRNGLPDNNIAALMMIRNKIWIASFSGLACLDTATNEIISFGKDDGFPALPIINNSRMHYDETTGHLYVLFSNTLTRFHPDSLLRTKAPPQLFFESLVIDNKKSIFLPGGQLETSWKDEEWRITIGTINLLHEHAPRFAYRIHARPDSKWVQLGNNPVFSLSGLSPGSHLIEIKAFSPNNRWPEQVKQLRIEVLPPLWRKPVFLVALALAALALIYALIRWRINVIRKKEMEKTRNERIKAEHYKNQYELEQITNYFSSSLAGKKTPEEALWDVAYNLIGRMKYEDCIIYLWNDSKTRMVQKAGWGPKGRPEAIEENVFEVLPGQGVVGHVIETKQPILIRDTRLDKRYRVDDAFRLSEVAVPIIHNNELLGVVDSEHRRVDFFTERDIKILTTIATLIGNKLKQIESENSLEAKKKELAGINEQLAEARLSALQAQMNPHFVFNALNSIKRMILEGDNDLASRYLSKFALMIRMTLEHSREIFATVDQQITYLNAYLDMEKLRFADRFFYEIDIDDAVDPSETCLPSMMIQPLVENALWHGLMPSKGEKRLRISFSYSGQYLRCIIEDNGIGIRKSEQDRVLQRPLHRSVGLENLRRRIRFMNEKYGTSSGIGIEDLSETEGRQGTRVILQFHIITTLQKI